MSFESFKAKLEDPKSKEHGKLLKHVKCKLDKSRSDMAKNYANWDRNDEIFRGLRPLDKEDRNAQAKGQPAKMIVPLVNSQIMTFVAFCVATATQNPRFYELEPTGKEDNPLREPMELILERDLRKNTWTSHLVQFFLDIGRFCIGAYEVCYTERYRMIRVPQTQEKPSLFGGTETEESISWQKIPTFIGNKIVPVSPYRIYPDTSLPLTRYQEGEFLGCEETWTMSTLKSESFGLFNLDKIPKMTDDMQKERQKTSRYEAMPTRTNPNMGATPGEGDAEGMVKSGPVLVDKVCIDIVPKDFNEEGMEELGTEDFPIRYLVWYGNDQTIIRFEEAYYLHGQFPWVIAQMTPDQHKTINESLADLCGPISDTITWLINAHITSVRSTIEGKWIIDPAGINIKSLESRSPYIFLKPNASETGVDRYIQQFKTEDSTQAFMADSQALKELQENITGYSAMMQGQHSAGRRSATQDRVVSQAGAARGKCTLSTIWDSAFEPLGKQLIANNRQEMDLETFARIVGDGPHSVNPTTGQGLTTEELYQLFHADALTIATSEDFFVFDGTTASEKSFLAQSLQEILMQMLSNPAIAQALGYGPQHFKQLFDDIYTLRGVTNSRMPAPMPPALPGPGTTPGQPPAAPGNVVPGPGAAANTAVS